MNLAPSNLRVEIVQRMRDISRREWDALLGPNDAPFVSWDWLEALEETGCTGEEAGWLPHHVLVRRGTTLVGALPMYVKLNSEGEFVFDWSWADLFQRLGRPYYPKLVAAVPFTPAQGTRLLLAVTEDRAALTAAIAQVLKAIVDDNDFSTAHVLFPEHDEATHWTNAGFIERNGIQFHFSNKAFESFEHFLSTLPSKRRTQIRRERAQLTKDNVTVRTLLPDEYTPESIDAMYTFYLATVDKFTWGRRYLTRAFFEEVASRFRNDLAWVFAKADQTPIAGAFNVRGPTSLYGRYWGTTHELPFLHFNVCYYHGIDECIVHKLATFEPGAGGEHKRPRGFDPTVTYSAHYVNDPKFRQVIASHLERERAAIRDHVRSEME